MISAGGVPGFRESGRDGSDEGASGMRATGSGPVAATPPADPAWRTFEIIADGTDEWHHPDPRAVATMTYNREERGHLRVGDRTYPCYVDMADVHGPDGKLLHRIRRALVRLESGWGVSCLWGDATYSSNGENDEFTETPTHVEVGILHHEDGLVDDPWSMQDVDDVNTLIAELATTPTRAAWMGKRRP